jgi:Dolichyl-phosphate-mannose-protein mannosyltransferase
VDTESTTSSRWWTGRAAEIAFVALALVAFVAVVVPTLHQPLLGNHAFRQTQTAYTARIYHEDGVDLLHPKLPVLGEPFEVPFEFPLFQATASVAMDVGFDDDTAMRLTGLACFLLTATLLYGLVRHVADRPSAIAALVAFVATPFSLVWGRASMIEYLATAGAVGFAWATVAWRDNRRPEVAGLALAAWLVGMLVKPTTAAFWILPALGYRPTSLRSTTRGRTVAVVAVLVLVPLVATALWTRHADAIKAASPTTDWLTSSELEDWNFGSLSQRFDKGVWGVVVGRIVVHLVGLAGIALLVVALVALVRSTQRLFWIGMGLAAGLPPLVFTNLYLVHDYYLAAVAPAFAALIGLGAGFVWRLLPPRPPIRAIALVAGLLLAASTVGFDYGYWRHSYDDDPDSKTLALARQLDSVSRPEDRIGVVGFDWSPALLYYADRWGLMVVDRREQVVLDTLHRDGYHRLLVNKPEETDLRPLERWRWLASVSENVYGVADSLGELPSSPLLATDAADVASGQALRRGVHVACTGVSTRVPSGTQGTLVRVSDPRAETRMWVSDQLAPLPVRRAILVAPELATNGTVALRCTGPTSLTIDVYAAGFPARP